MSSQAARTDSSHPWPVISWIWCSPREHNLRCAKYGRRQSNSMIDTYSFRSTRRTCVPPVLSTRSPQQKEGGAPFLPVHLLLRFPHQQQSSFLSGWILLSLGSATHGSRHILLVSWFLQAILQHTFPTLDFLLVSVGPYFTVLGCLLYPAH